jgi:hypothetical protein
MVATLLQGRGVEVETVLQILPKKKQPMAWIAERVWDAQAVITLLSTHAYVLRRQIRAALRRAQ